MENLKRFVEDDDLQIYNAVDNDIILVKTNEQYYYSNNYK